MISVDGGRARRLFDDRARAASVCPLAHLPSDARRGNFFEARAPGFPSLVGQAAVPP